MESEVFERIREYLADQLDVEPEKITPTARLSRISAPTASMSLI